MPTPIEVLDELKRYVHIPWAVQQQCHYLFGELRALLEADDRAHLDATSEHLRKKYYSARRCYAERNLLTPSGAKAVAKGKPGKTWEQWWNEMYSDNLDRFIKQCQDTGLKDRIRDFENAKYGSSMLDEPAKASAA